MKKFTLSHSSPSRKTLCDLCREHEHQFSHQWDAPLGEIQLYTLSTDTLPAGLLPVSINLCEFCAEMADDGELSQFIS